MLYRFIPNTDIKVSTLSFGNFIYGSGMWGKTSADEPQGVALQNKAFDLGVNFFDTADAYDNGRAEKMMRETITYAGRDKIVLSTKVGYDFYSDPGSAGAHRERKQDFSPAFLDFALEQSLKRLNTDYIDLWQAHNIKLPQMTDELRTALERLKLQGKIRAWGIALGPAIGWREEGAAAIEQWRCATVQTVFNMLEQHPGLEFCHRSDQTCSTGIISRVPHSSGILQDIYTADMTFTDHRKFRDRNWLVYGLKKVELLREIQETHRCTLGQLAIKWLLSFPKLISVQPNIATEAELLEFAAAASDPILLSGEEMKKIGDLVENDFGFGPEAHACDLKSSITDSGVTRSEYQLNTPIPKLNPHHTQLASSSTEQTPGSVQR